MKGRENHSAFVARTDFGSHSMTHQMLISSSVPAAAPAFSPTSHFLHASPPLLFTRSSSPTSCSQASAAPAMASFVAHHHGFLGERMDVLRSSLRPCVAAEEVDAAAAAAAGPAAWGAADRGAGLLGDGFSVEDLLDLEDLCEVDKDCVELGEPSPAPAPVAVEEDKLSSDSHVSSVVSYELVPLPVQPVIDLPLPAHDAEELEWVSRIMDDSLAELPPPPKLPAAAISAAAERRPPVERAVVPAAAEPKRTPTICALSTEVLVPVKAKRSKRSRGSVWSRSGGAPLSDSTSSSSTTSSCSSSGSFSPFLFLPLDSQPPSFWAAHLLGEAAPPLGSKSKKSKHGKNSGGGGKPKKRGRKPKHHPFRPQLAGGGASAAPVAGDRRCSHCGVNKTPQWRAGPEGAKTLCNACGVRYKSGRLLPEYRPACSPTFVSSIHSNSHRKVLEMRRKKEGVLLLPGPPPLPAVAPAVASF